MDGSGLNTAPLIPAWWTIWVLLIAALLGATAFLESTWWRNYWRRRKQRREGRIVDYAPHLKGRRR